MLKQFLSTIDWFSFALGFGAAAVLIWAVSAIGGWLRSIFVHEGSKPFGQRVAAAVRNLITGLLILGALALAGYIAYSVFFKPPG